MFKIRFKGYIACHAECHAEHIHVPWVVMIGDHHVTKNTDETNSRVRSLVQGHRLQTSPRDGQTHFDEKLWTSFFVFFLEIEVSRLIRIKYLYSIWIAIFTNPSLHTSWKWLYTQYLPSILSLQSSLYSSFIYLLYKLALYISFTYYLYSLVLFTKLIDFIYK